MVKEIESEGDAETRVRTLFAGNTAFRLQTEQDIKDYAKIAFFLTDPKRVQTALEEVSKQIWIRYNFDELKQSPNRFSRALIKYGVDVFGFAVQDNVVFVGPRGGPEFLTYVRDGVLWKDTFAPEHGEFAHSLQWFAAGQALNLGTRTAFLYKKAGGVFSKSDQLATRGDSGNLERARQPLWAWLVDCFWPGQLESQIPDTDILHVFSKRTCRVPNEANKLVLGKKSWFIRLYLDHRKKWFDKLTEAGIKMRKDANETEELDSKMLGIMKYQAKAYKAKAEWQPDNAAITTPSGNPITRSDPPKVFKKASRSNTTKDQAEATFHGIKGTLSMRAIDQKSLIS
jgi:hypothetical protein